MWFSGIIANLWLYEEQSEHGIPFTLEYHDKESLKAPQQCIISIYFVKDRFSCFYIIPKKSIHNFWKQDTQSGNFTVWGFTTSKYSRRILPNLWPAAFQLMYSKWVFVFFCTSTISLINLQHVTTIIPIFFWWNIPYHHHVFE